ncbi:hypothetical protein INR49_030630 [Caranx melampygus]|nr:hypothetical protein INR49_030630 [Caranx melampygus]
MELNESPNRTDGGEAGLGDEQRTETHANGTSNGTSPGARPESPQRQQRLPSTSLDAVKEALRDSANEFELRYSRAFSDLHNQLHITPATAYQSFANVMDEVFRDGFNWGRIIGLFVFGGALCVECVEKEMSPLVGRIVEWMTVYLDNRIQPWIQSQGGWTNKGLTHLEESRCHSLGKLGWSGMWMVRSIWQSKEDGTEEDKGRAKAGADGRERKEDERKRRLEQLKDLRLRAGSSCSKSHLAEKPWTGLTLMSSILFSCLACHSSSKVLGVLG